MKIKGVGIPFSIHQSSCSNRTPKNFEWTKDDAEIEVWMDMQILTGVMKPRSHKGVKKYAWICESRAIIPGLYQPFLFPELLDEIVNAYDGIFTCDRELVDKHEKIHFCYAGSNLPWISEKEYKIHEKSKGCSFLASSKKMTEAHDFRHSLYDNFKVRIKGSEIVWLFGSITGKSIGYQKNCHIKNSEGVAPWHDKTDALKDFRFSIVAENDQYDDYFTEKLTDCFATGTVPLYYGTKNIGKYFNMEGIIEIPNDVAIVDFIVTNRLTSDLYYGKMDAIKDNFERVKNMQSADDMMFEKIQELNN